MKSTRITLRQKQENFEKFAQSNYKAINVMKPTEVFYADFGGGQKERGTSMQNVDITNAPSWYDNAEKEIERAMDSIYFQTVFAN